MKTYITRVLVLVFLVVLGMAANSWATISYNLGSVFPNQPPLTGTNGPWLTANFDTDTTDNGVKLTVSANNLPTGGYVDELYFNFTGSVPGDLNINITSENSTAAALQHQDPFGVNKNADGGGEFDIYINLTNSQNHRLANGGTITFLITGTGISVESQFNDKNSTELYYMAAHVAGYGPTGSTSTYVGTPIPSSAWLLGSSLIGLIGFGRRKTRNYFA